MPNLKRIGWVLYTFAVGGVVGQVGKKWQNSSAQTSLVGAQSELANGQAFWLWPRRSPIFLNVCLSVSVSPWQNSSIITSELNNSAPDHLIELKFSTLNHLRMYIMMLMSEGCPGVSLRVPWGWLWDYSEISNVIHILWWLSVPNFSSIRWSGR